MANFSFYSLSERKLGESGLFGLLHSAFVAGIGKSSINTNVIYCTIRVLFDHSDLKHGYMNTFILSSMLSIDIIFHHLMCGYSAKQSSVQSQSVSLYFNIVCLVSFDHCAHGQDF